MLEELKNKTFANEAEEAAWWKANEDGLLEDFKKAAAEGRVQVGVAARRAATPTTTIRLDTGDIALARAQAAARGLRYQTYLKMILHEALIKAGQNSASSQR